MMISIFFKENEEKASLNEKENTALAQEPHPKTSASSIKLV